MLAAKQIKKGSLSKRKRRENIMGWLFIMPAVILFVVLILLPILIALITGFSDFNGINKFEPWGFGNYKDLFGFDMFYFRKSLVNLSLYVVLFVPANLLISFVLALLVSKTSRATKFFRLMYYIPSLTSGIAVATVWGWMLNPEMGIINHVLRTFGLKGVNWINDPNMSMITITIVSLWGGTAANMVLFIAAIQGIDESLIEAAKIEGANAFKVVTKITVPLVSPITYFVITTVFIGSFQLYDQAVMLFPGGGVQNSALTPLMVIHKAINTGLRYGKAAAMSTVLLVIVTILTFVLNKLNKRLTEAL